MNHFGFGISAGLTVFMLLMIRSSIADYEIKIMMFDYPKYNDQTIFTVMVKGDDTVANLKNKINEVIKVELEPERLMLRSDMRPYDAPFEDTKTMNNYGIVKDSLLYLTLDEFEMFVHYNEQNYPIWVSEKDTVKFLKIKTIRELNLDSTLEEVMALEKAQLFDRDIVYDTLDAFKIWMKIQTMREIGILRDQQKLAAADGVVLEEDEKTMNYYKIKEHSTVLLTRAAAEMEQQHDEMPSSSRKKEKNLGSKIMGFLHRHSG
ncbi:hypothetical protein niasHS_016859 [Heterodera schachtii]|uniref:Ubiquitin-like domain-containing protein n=1 Tax=Heterodera schachtii TaxID=97005 RepID=A0ABD2HYU7_HETSC